MSLLQLRMMLLEI